MDVFYFFDPKRLCPFYNFSWEGLILQQSNSLEQRQTQRRGVFIGFASLIFMYWAAMAPLSYNTLLLQGSGFSSAEVGSIMAAFAAVGIIAPPIWGYIADRIRSASKTFYPRLWHQAVVIASLPLFGGLKLGGFVLLALAMPLSNFVRNCSQKPLERLDHAKHHPHRGSVWLSALVWLPGVDGQLRRHVRFGQYDLMFPSPSTWPAFSRHRLRDGHAAQPQVSLSGYDRRYGKSGGER